MSSLAAAAAPKVYDFYDLQNAEPPESVLRTERFGKNKSHPKTKKIHDLRISQTEARNDRASACVHPVMLNSVHASHAPRFFNFEDKTSRSGQDRLLIEWLCELANDSPSARILLQVARQRNWSVALGDTGLNDYSLNTAKNIITLNHQGFNAERIYSSGHYRHRLFIAFVKALRQIWQNAHDKTVREHNLPETLLLLQRARAADCETISILTGWELRAAGHTDIWRYILGSDQGDMAMVFTQAMEKDPAGYYDGSVLARTFCQWYDDGRRISLCDHTILEDLDVFLKEKGRLGKAAITGFVIEKLSILPCGNSYLSGMGRIIASDPYFCSIHDSINESHLFQIAHDSQVCLVGGVPFRDRKLASLIFPDGKKKLKQQSALGGSMPDR